MAVIRTELIVDAPIGVVFDLSRSIDLHEESMHSHGERAIGGTTAGLIELDQTVTWRARHFGVWHELTARITAMDPPLHFRDSMVRGIFRRFDHDHFFEARDRGTLMTDVFDYTSPLGPLGRAADILFLKRYMTRFLAKRNRFIKEIAESRSWRRFVEPTAS